MILVVHVTGVSFAPGMTHEATNPCSMTVCVMARECKESSAPGEVPEEVFSDGGSTPPASTKRTLHEHLLFKGGFAVLVWL